MQPLPIRENDNREGSSTAIHRWLYRGQRPNRLARMLNRVWAAVASVDAAPNHVVTLEVLGRKSERMNSLRFQSPSDLTADYELNASPFL
jgi:hypothetical protein